jgi:hypothetical protein
MVREQHDLNEESRLVQELHGINQINLRRISPRHRIEQSCYTLRRRRRLDEVPDIVPAMIGM